MKRIFIMLVVFGTLLLLAAYVLGLSVREVTTADAAARAGLRWHMLTALAAICFASLVHAIWLTYFMGTGRWMEETCRAYGLPDDFPAENHSMKYGTIPAIAGVFLLLLVTGGFGAAVDPGSSVKFTGWAGFSGAMIHFLLASTALGANAIVNFIEYQTISRNNHLINQVMDEVRRMRIERGLPV